MSLIDPTYGFILFHNIKQTEVAAEVAQLTWSVTVVDATRMIGIIILYSFFSVMRPVVFVWSV